MQPGEPLANRRGSNPWSKISARTFASGPTWALKPRSALVVGRGLEKTRHKAIAELWFQDALQRQKFVLVKLGGDHSPVVVLTKPLPQDTFVRHLGSAGGRHVPADTHPTGDGCDGVRTELYKHVHVHGAASAKSDFVFVLRAPQQPRTH